MSQVAQPGKGGVVLAVDDDKLIRQLISAILETAGYTVFTAGSREQAFKTLGVMKPTLLLLDVELGQDNGYDICRDIRQTFPNLDPVIVFVTSRRTKDDVKAALDAGGHYFIVKPFSPEGLLDAISKAVIARHRQTRQSP
jgi:DNA-binding response OmpR family regulator